MNSDTDNLIEVIKVRENGEEHYHRKPDSERYQFYPKAEIPVRLFEAYIQHRTLMLEFRMRIKNYFYPLKDKPMKVAKYHLGE